MPWWQEFLLLAVIALVAAALIKAFVVQMFFVPSASMNPELVEDDRIVVEKISYWSGPVERGEVVVFEDPGGWLGTTPEPTGLQQALSWVGLYPDGGHLVKRVVGLPGDTVACCDAEGRVTVNGDPLREDDYLGRGIDPSDREFEVTVPEDAFWMLGDNRPNSRDSRFHTDDRLAGAVPRDAVVGRVWAIVWPVDRFEVLELPSYVPPTR